MSLIGHNYPHLVPFCRIIHCCPWMGKISTKTHFSTSGINTEMIRNPLEKGFKISCIHRVCDARDSGSLETKMVAGVWRSNRTVYLTFAEMYLHFLMATEQRENHLHMVRQRARLDSARRPERQGLMSLTVCFTLRSGGRAGGGRCVGVRVLKEKRRREGEKERREEYLSHNPAAQTAADQRGHSVRKWPHWD